MTKNEPENENQINDVEGSIPEDNPDENQSVTNEEETDGVDEEVNEENAEVTVAVNVQGENVNVTVMESVPNSGRSSPMRSSTQAATAPHLDLKFYHSSLW